MPPTSWKWLHLEGVLVPETRPRENSTYNLSQIYVSAADLYMAFTCMASLFDSRPIAWRITELKKLLEKPSYNE